MGRYGSRRIQQALEQKNIKVNCKRISRLMSQHGLVAKGARKAYRHHPNKSQYAEKENILKQVFSAKEKNTIWVGDITYIPTRHGFLYLAIFLEIFSRKVVGWAMDTPIRETLVMSAFNQTIGREHPKEGLIVHTDRGSQAISGITVTIWLSAKYEPQGKFL